MCYRPDSCSATSGDIGTCIVAAAASELCTVYCVVYMTTVETTKKKKQATRELQSFVLHDFMERLDKTTKEVLINGNE